MGAIDDNRKYATQLGWTPADFGESDFDDTLVLAIKHAQSALGVQADGVCGPITYRAWLDRELARLQSGRSSSSDWLKDAGLITLYTAKRTWLGKIIDPPDASAQYDASRKMIDEMIRTPEGLDWTWSDPYIHDGDYQWCGAFASFAWRAGGVAQKWRYTFFSSTFRLDVWARYQAFQHEPNPRPKHGPYRQLVELDEKSTPDDVQFPGGQPVRAGDILLVGGEQPGYGHHVTIIESFDPQSRLFTTIEGNGTGVWPNGVRVQGVVRARRPLGLTASAPPTMYHARRLIRPALADLE